MNLRRTVVAITVVAATLHLVMGIWAFLAPRSFYDVVATFEPFNQHFLRDIGAFQIGLGAVLLFALTRLDGLAVALGGIAAAATLHLVSHIIDRDAGGRATDPFGLAVFATVLVLAFLIWARHPQDHGNRPPES